MEHERLRDKQLVFTVTTGRSGTGLLAEQLKYVSDASVYHEGEPGFHDHLRAVVDGRERAQTFLFEQKLPFIAQLPTPVYIETSHLFCKGFLEPLLESGLVPDLILLKRPERDVAKSLYQLGTIPGRDDKARAFYLMPTDPVYLPLPGWEEMHDYQLCFWYTLEIARRQQIYRQLVSSLGGRVVEVTLREVSEGNGVKKIANELGLSPPPTRFPWRKSKRVNQKSHKKKAFDMADAELFGLEREVYNATNFLGVRIRS